jgi:transposase
LASLKRVKNGVRWADTAIEAQVGAPVSTAYLYDLLHRHQWRKVMPRPRHVRADPDVQEAFKKF